MKKQIKPEPVEKPIEKYNCNQICIILQFGSYDSMAVKTKFKEFILPVEEWRIVLKNCGILL